MNLDRVVKTGAINLLNLQLITYYLLLKTYYLLLITYYL